MAAPFRKCDHCAKPAVVHQTVIADGKVANLHLCEEHAAEHGIAADGHAPITQLLGQLASAGAARARGPACPHCGHTFNDFKSTGLLGCPGCYECFATTVAPVIERAQGGGSEHVGRAPAEQYERAARLRDRIRDLRQGPAAATPPGGAP